MKKKLILLLLLFSANDIFSQLEELLISPPYYIKTVQVNDGKSPKPSPFIELGHTVYISFDDLQADNKDYYYKIVRYDENWEPTQLMESEYIDGFASDVINNSESSTGTLQSYTHYSMQIPNDNIRILLSGNYMLQILDDEDNLIFNRPFVLYEKKINIAVQVKWANEVQMRNRWQIVDFSLYKSGFQILNESNSLTVRVFQNNDINYYKEFHQPTFYKGSEWVYHYPQQSVFEGINEFRRFETRDLRGYNYGIAHRQLNDLYDFYPYAGAYRTHYLFYKDINGSYILASEQAENVNTEADYVNVHFQFEGNLEVGEHIYVIGRFNNYTPAPAYELHYDETKQAYTTQVLLKQAYYDYMFVTKNQRGELDITTIEGSFAQTENDYQVLAYYKAPGARYTQVIGFGKANSDQIK